MFQTLDELKAENAAAEGAPIESQEEVETPEANAELPEDEAETDAQGEAETPDWLKSDDDQASQSVPLAKFVETKHKLKSRLVEKDSAIEALKAELEALKAGRSAVVAEPVPLKMPRLSDFDFDEDRYAEALLSYQEQMIERKLNQHQGSKAAEQKAVELQRQVSEAVEKHYERAAELVQSGVIKEDVYRAADSTVRNIVQQNLGLQPDDADSITDRIISKIGTHSEKIIAHIGVNKAAQAKVAELLRSDPSGMDLMLYFGELKAKVSGANAVKSTNRIKPDSGIQGDAAAKVSATALQKQYEKAQKSGDTAAAFKIKMQAKQAGANTSNW